MDALSSNQQAPFPPPTQVNQKVIQGACQTLNGLDSMANRKADHALSYLEGLRAHCHAYC